VAPNLEPADRRWILGSDNRFSSTTFRSCKAAAWRGERLLLAFGLRVFDVDAEAWELRGVLRRPGGLETGRATT
jgi:hypothetical protein